MMNSEYKPLFKWLTHYCWRLASDEPFQIWPLEALVRKSITYPYMDFQESTDINMDIYDFWMSVFNFPYKCGYPHWYPSRDIHTRAFCNWYPKTMNIHERISMFIWISVFNHPCFYGYPFGYHWISMGIHTLACYGFSIQGGVGVKSPQQHKILTTPQLDFIKTYNLKPLNTKFSHLPPGFSHL